MNSELATLLELKHANELAGVGTPKVPITGKWCLGLTGIFLMAAIVLFVMADSAHKRYLTQNADLGGITRNADGTYNVTVTIGGSAVDRARATRATAESLWHIALVASGVSGLLFITAIVIIFRSRARLTSHS